VKHPSLFVLVLVGSAFVSPVLAQTERTPPLKGPSVKDGSVPGEQRRFAGGGGVRERMQGEIPHRLFRQALDSLRGEDVPEGVRLTQDQDRRLREIEQTFFNEMAMFREQHANEVRTLIAKLAPEDRRRAAEFLRGPGRPGADRPGPRAETEEKEKAPGGGAGKADPEAAKVARERLKEILQSAPKAVEVHAKMIAVLSDAQRDAFKANLERLRKEAQQSHEDGMRAKPGKEGGKAENGKARLNIGERGARGEDLPPRLKDRLRNMTPEERAEAIKRFRERRKENQNQPK
jgi:hypothetical protein